MHGLSSTAGCSSWAGMGAYVQPYAYNHMYIYRHPHPSTPMSMHVHPSTHIYTHLHPRTNIYTHLPPCTPTHTHVHSSTPIGTHVHPCTPMYAHLRPCTRICSHVHPRAVPGRPRGAPPAHMCTQCAAHMAAPRGYPSIPAGRLGDKPCLSHAPRRGGGRVCCLPKGGRRELDGSCSPLLQRLFAAVNLASC